MLSNHFVGRAIVTVKAITDRGCRCPGDVNIPVAMRYPTAQLQCKPICKKHDFSFTPSNPNDPEPLAVRSNHGRLAMDNVILFSCLSKGYANNLERRTYLFRTEGFNFTVQIVRFNFFQQGIENFIRRRSCILQTAISIVGRKYDGRQARLCSALSNDTDWRRNDADQDHRSYDRVSHLNRPLRAHRSRPHSQAAASCRKSWPAAPAKASR